MFGKKKKSHHMCEHSDTESHSGDIVSLYDESRVETFSDEAISLREVESSETISPDATPDTDEQNAIDNVEINESAREGGTQEQKIAQLWILSKEDFGPLKNMLLTTRLQMLTGIVIHFGLNTQIGSVGGWTTVKSLPNLSIILSTEWQFMSPRNLTL